MITSLSSSSIKTLGASLAVRIFAALMVLTVLLFLANQVLVYWFHWPEFLLAQNYTSGFLAWLRLVLFIALALAVIGWAIRQRQHSLHHDAQLYSDMSFYIIRVAFWAVFLIGLTDTLISVLRVENVLISLVGSDLTSELGRARFRGAYVHYPLIAVSFIIAYFVRSLGFIWLTLLVVFAEFQIVISRFVFSYEQAFMADLVRFWYAALFLFGSAYTLVEEGHVRVDVFYANFSKRGKAWTNVIGSLLLGLPLCWVILTQGMATRGSSLTSPLLSFEISQSGYGLYVKYLMAGFLIVFAVSMAIQFVSYFLANAGTLCGEKDDMPKELEEHLGPSVT